MLRLCFAIVLLVCDCAFSKKALNTGCTRARKEAPGKKDEASRKLAKQRSGKQKEQVLSLHAEVIPGLEFLMSSVATDYPHLRLCHIRHRLKEAFERGMV